MRIFDTDQNAILSSNGNDVVAVGSIYITMDSDTEVSMRRFEENDRFRVRIYNGYLKWLNLNDLYDGVADAWLIPPSVQKDYGTRFIGSVNIVANDDFIWSNRGIAGDGVDDYFDTNFNPSIRITDMDNFSIFLYVDTDTDQGFDLGCDDTTNALLISTRNSDLLTFTVGTATKTYESLNSIGVWCMNVRDGEMYVYKNGINIDIGSPGVTIAGSLPNLTMYLSAFNNNGGDGDEFSDKRYSYLSIHNGLITEEQVEKMSLQIEILQTNLIRGHAIS